ncbi:MAG: hypothetical protein M1827_005595 [Pycnora praestabilis]|nr:MAG: hypothetical protein M1827_005595 [Pycnora praestabilis]
MYETSQVLSIAAPPSLVWEVLTDLSSYPLWNPFIPACSSTLQPGSSIKMSVKLFSFAQPQVEKMREYDEGRHFAYSMIPVPFCLSSYRSHDVESLGGEMTRYTSVFRLKGWMSRVVEYVVGRRLKNGFGGMSEAVKRRAEELWVERRSKSNKT